MPNDFFSFSLQGMGIQEVGAKLFFLFSKFVGSSSNNSTNIFLLCRHNKKKNILWIVRKRLVLLCLFRTLVSSSSFVSLFSFHSHSPCLTFLGGETWFASSEFVRAFETTNSQICERKKDNQFEPNPTKHLAHRNYDVLHIDQNIAGHTVWGLWSSSYVPRVGRERAIGHPTLQALI